MKKILFLLLICLIKLNAYEYIVTNSTDPSNIVRFFSDPNGVLTFTYINHNVVYENSTSNGSFFQNLGQIGHSIHYITKSKFNNYYKSDINFLNDLYSQKLQPFLNYLYNTSIFNGTNYLVYSDYEILYNSDGLAVESIVNGKWAGLYDGPDNSGYLYNEKGDLLYKNGVPVSFLEKINNMLLKKFKINLESIFIKKIFYPLLVLIFACVIFRSVIRMAFKAFLIRFYDKKIGQLEKRREKIENA